MEDRTVYIRDQERVQIKEGFESISEIEDYIKETYKGSPGEYEYGFLDQLSSIEISKPNSQIGSMDQNRKQKLNAIRENIQHSSLCKDITFIHDPYTKHHVKKYGRSVTYTSEITFTLDIDYGEFSRICLEKFGDTVDISRKSVDKNVESEIIDIFNTLVSNNAYYMGYVSGFKTRKREDRYLKLYGHVWENNMIRNVVLDIIDNEFVIGGFLKKNRLNMTIPQHFRNKGANVDDLDYTVIFNIDNDNEFEQLQKKEQVLEYIEQLQNQGLNYTWIGITSYYDSHSQLCAAVKFNK